MSTEPRHVIEIRDAGDHLEFYPLPADPLQAFRGSLKQDISLANELIEEHKLEVKRDADS